MTQKMDLSRFLSLAKLYNDLGWSIQDQLRAVARGSSMSKQNSNALEIIAQFLRCASDDIEGAEELAEDIEQHLKSPDLCPD